MVSLKLEHCSRQVPASEELRFSKSNGPLAVLGSSQKLCPCSPCSFSLLLVFGDGNLVVFPVYSRQFEVVVRCFELLILLFVPWTDFQ